MLDEADSALCKQIRAYWTDLGLGFTSCTTVPWSAVFVSWCVKKAGATATEFKFAAAHSVFVNAAINNPGAFQGLDIKAAKPAIGDIVQNNRSGSKLNFDYAKSHSSYESHSAIVVEVGTDVSGGYAMTIGGNESNSIRRTLVRLDGNGFIKQRAQNPYICLLKNVK
ncbi:DUF2272 domain-containing protein [Methylobacterium trifolii]|nr:DUF2272 domain-containing protein [Methylobacterium trifolii]